MGGLNRILEKEPGLFPQLLLLVLITSYATPVGLPSVICTSISLPHVCLRISWQAKCFLPVQASGIQYVLTQLCFVILYKIR